MRALKFTLWGDYAFFRKPEYNNFVNEGHSFITFNQIPKTYILGILGGILGLPSITEEFNKNNFYQTLKDVNISIVPQKAHFLKETHKYLDSSGMFFLDKRENLIINEELLIKPQWDIFVLEGFELHEKLKDDLFNKKSKTHIFLGKNEFFANIENVSEIDVTKAQIEDRFVEIKSMFVAKDLEKDDLLESDEYPYLYKEYLPISYNLDSKYNYDLFYFTNQPVNKEKVKSELYYCNNDLISFF